MDKVFLAESVRKSLKEAEVAFSIKPVTEEEIEEIIHRLYPNEDIFIDEYIPTCIGLDLYSGIYLAQEDIDILIAGYKKQPYSGSEDTYQLTFTEDGIQLTTDLYDSVEKKFKFEYHRVPDGEKRCF